MNRTSIVKPINGSVEPLLVPIEDREKFAARAMEKLYAHTGNPTMTSQTATALSNAIVAAVIPMGK